MLINRIADKALGQVLPKVTAGACVPEVGQTCKCVFYDWCIPSNTRTWFVYTYTCQGLCTYHTTTPCGGLCRVGT